MCEEKRRYIQDETIASVLNKSSALPWVWRHAGSKQMTPIFPSVPDKDGEKTGESDSCFFYLSHMPETQQPLWTLWTPTMDWMPVSEVTWE